MANLKFILRTIKNHVPECKEKDKPGKERNPCDCPTEYKTNSRGESAIFLRITGNGEVGYMSTKIWVQPETWDADKQRIQKNALFNKRLDDFKRYVDKVNGYDKSYSDIRTALQGNGGNDFVEYAEGVINSLRIDGKYWAAENAKFAIEKLKRCEGKNHIPFKKITPEYIRKFDNYLREKLKNRTNTVTKNLGSLKRIFRQAEREKKISRDENPFYSYTLKKEHVSKRKLIDEEIDKIVNLELPENSLIWHVRNYFMFSFFSGGMRFIDVAHLKWGNINEGVLKYTMSKTEKELEFDLLPPAANILEYYEPAENGKFIFPLLPDGIEEKNITTQKKILSAKNALVNKYLVKIQERAGIWQREIRVKDEKTGTVETKLINEPRLSMHISRHSFAYYAMRNGMTLFEIQAMLGHSSAVITETYLKSLSPESISTALKTTFKKFLIPGDKKILELAK